MSSGAGSPSAFRQETQLTAEDPEVPDRHVTQSTISYLLQEATKLATPANADGLTVSGGLGENHREDSLSPSNSTSVSVHSPKESGSSSASHLSGTLSILLSPWEVMSLINLQCERLLHPGCEKGEKEDFDPALPDLDTRELSVSDKISECSDSILGPGASPLSPYETGDAQNITCIGDTVCISSSESSVCHSLLSVTENKVQTQASGFPDESKHCKETMDITEFVAKNTEDSFDITCHFSQGKEEREFSFTDAVEKEENLYDQHVELATPQVHQEGQSTCNLRETEDSQNENTAFSYADKTIDLTSTLLLETDCNSNVCFTLDSCKDTGANCSPQLCALNNETDLEASCSEKNISELPCDLDPNNNNVDDDTSTKPSDTEEIQAVSSQTRWQRRNPRKQPHPTRSADLQDPDLQGVAFRMYTELDDSKDQCRLLITSNYREEFCRRTRRSRGSRSRSLHSSQRTSSSEEEGHPSNISKNKMCASCCTIKTPLWRDAEDGTPLCNACGIRYKKYGVRCPQCWNIPKKEGNSSSKCLKCGDVLKLASHNKRNNW